jgi:uncharacterized protein
MVDRENNNPWMTNFKIIFIRENNVDWAIVIGVTAAGILVADAITQYIFTQIVLDIFERQLPLKVEPCEPNPDAELLSIPTSGGLQLKGSLLQHPPGQSRGVIVFFPELNGTHSSALNYCQALWNDGFDILSFDFRNQGESDCQDDYSPLHWVTNFEIDDARAAIDYARSREDLQHLPMGLVGVSRGGGVALTVATQVEGIEFVAVEGAFSTNGLALHYAFRWASLFVPPWVLKIVPLWHIRMTIFLTRLRSQLRRRCRFAPVERSLPRLRNKKVLMISGMSDSYVPNSVAEKMVEKIGGKNCQLWKVRKARHNQARRVDPEKYDAQLVEFFSSLGVKRSPSIEQVQLT